MKEKPHSIALNIALSPAGCLSLTTTAEEQTDFILVNSVVATRTLLAFNHSSARGLLHLASKELLEELPSVLAFWRRIGVLFLGHLCNVSDLEECREAFVLPAPIHELSKLVAGMPAMRGSEYGSLALFQHYWDTLQVEVRASLREYQGHADDFLHALHPSWNLVGRVCFHLAENKQSQDLPFAFLATYATKLSTAGKPQHMPLGRALQDLSGRGNTSALLALLKPVQKATEQSQRIKQLVDSGDIYHPQRWSAQEAHLFLKEIPLYEASGIIVRVPDWWQAKQPSRPKVQITLGTKAPAGFGLNALIDFNMALTLGDDVLTEAEAKELQETASGLVAFKGRWVEVDQAKLAQVLDHWRDVQRMASSEGLSFAKAMRMMTGASRLDEPSRDPAATTSDAEWSHFVAGGWLRDTLTSMRGQGTHPSFDLGQELKATLRPYQKAGVEWLWLLHQLRLGACLADDMGLGKTIQVLALMLLLKQQGNNSRTLLVVPASLLANWQSEAKEFAPSLTFCVWHPSSQPLSMDDDDGRRQSQASDVTMTTYSYLSRQPWLAEQPWQLMVLDEAQAIKNPGAKQSLAAKTIAAEQRIALTGTPVENRLSDLWSLFDFICPGLLGGAKAFSQFVKTHEAAESSLYQTIRKLVQPYLLRRLKTDRSIIADLPDKTEIRAYCSLTKFQASLYEQTVQELAQKIADADGIQRRGLILAALMRLKQICNHPAQWLGDGNYDPKASGKMLRLREIAEEIAAKQEKVLVFTQFREITQPLSQYLGSIFGQEGLILHGGTPVKTRKSLVDAFQAEAGPPYFVLSLKAGGTGLNLTAASHVVHFDRWWNPAVENQATDRAFRIGQKRNVMVHKFICKGTLEDSIDKVIEAKKRLATELLSGGSEAVLTEMSNEQLLKLLTLDLRTAMDVD